MQGDVKQEGKLIISTPRRAERSDSPKKYMNYVKSKDGNLILIP